MRFPTWVAGPVLSFALSTVAHAQAVQDPMSGLTELLTSCADGDKCAVVETVPCGCASGGGYVAINGNYEKLWAEIENFLKSRPPEVLCAQSYHCNDHALAVCRQGRCRVEVK